MNALDTDTPQGISRRPMRKYTVLIVDTGQPDCNLTEELVAKAGDYRPERVALEKVSANPSAHQPDIVVLDLGNPSTAQLDVLVEIRGNYGDVPVIIVSEALDDAQMRRLLKLKIHDWQRKPLVFTEFQSALQGSIRNAKQVANRVHAVISAVGGAGGTTVSISLADILSRRLAKQKTTVGLFDLDFSSGSVGQMLNVQAKLNLDSVITNPARIDHEFVAMIQQAHDRGFVVYSFKRRDFVTHLNGYEVVLRLLDAVTLEHGHTILDIPYYEVDWAQDVLSAVNSVTVVAEMNIPSIKHALDVLRMVRELPGNARPVNVLLNKREGGLFKRSRIPEAKLRELFDGTPYSFLPRDHELMSEALDRGIVPSEVKPRARFIKALESYADTVILNEKGAAK
jgi:pilus assembly protein CpaE